MADYAGAKEAIRERLEDMWATTPITLQNKAKPEPWPPTDAEGMPAPWVNLEVSSLPSSMIGGGMPGHQVWRQPGFIYVHVFVPTGTGDALANRYAVDLGEIFRGKVFYCDTPGCYVRCWAPRIDGGGSGDDNGNWFRVTMSVPFDYIHLG